MIHPHVAMFLVHLLNACLRASYFPRTWKTGDLKILLKDPSGDMSSVKNYRPITLLPEYGKIFEKIVRKRLYEVQPQLHSPSRYGFVQGKSTIDALKKYKNLVSDPIYRHTAILSIAIPQSYSLI
jgi:hypothetical protein